MAMHFSRPRVFPRALGCGAPRGAAGTLGASLGPGRAPSRTLWAFKVTRAGNWPRDRFSPSKSRAGQQKPHNLRCVIFAFCSAAAASCLHHTVPQALTLSTLWQPRHNSSRTSSSFLCDSHWSCMCVQCSSGDICTCPQSWSHLFPRTTLKSNTRRRTSSCCTVYSSTRGK